MKMKQSEEKREGRKEGRAYMRTQNTARTISISMLSTLQNAPNKSVLQEVTQYHH